jgi:ABC-type multidrug transport system fused ATPase/permease subunit
MTTPKPRELRFKTDQTFSSINVLDKYLTYFFVTPLVDFAQTASVPIAATDIWQLPAYEDTENLVRIFDDARAQTHGGAGLIRPMLATGGRLLYVGGFFIGVKAVAEVFLPVLVNIVIRKVANQEFDGLYYALAFLAVTASSQLSNQLHLRCMEIGSNRLRAALNFVIFRHAIQLRSYTTTTGASQAAEPFGKQEATKSSSSGLSQVMTLVASDTQRFVDVSPHVHLLWASPLQVALGTYFLYTFLGYAAFAAVGILMLMYPMSLQLSKVQAGTRRIYLQHTQHRVRLISEFLQGIRVVKMYGWEPFLLDAIMALRAKEMACMVKELLVWVINTSAMIAGPQVALVVTLTIFVYTGGVLTSANAFATLAMLAILKFPVMYFGQALLVSTQAMIGCERISSFLLTRNADDAIKDERIIDAKDGEVSSSHHTPFGNDTAHRSDDNRTHELQAAPAAAFDASSRPLVEPVVKFESASFQWNATATHFTLSNVTLRLSRKQCCVILGPVGSGKTLLCHALIGEAIQVGGNAVVESHSIAYAAQEPFLLTGTVRDNIIFFRPFDEAKFRAVLDACQLWQDLEAYTDGEMTIVGERGVTLSGGQKARISLARAAYASDAALVVLDDPFSALDARTGKLVAQALLGEGGLLQQQAVVLVTHAHSLMAYADHIIELSQGAAIMTPSSPSACFESADPPADELDGEDSSPKNAPFSPTRKLKDASEDKMVEAENVTATVKSRTYWDFFKAGGGFRYLGGCLIGLSIERTLYVASDTWLAMWTSASNGAPTNRIAVDNNFPSGLDKSGAIFYLRVYAVLVVIVYFGGVARLSFFAIGGYFANANLFQRAFSALTKCPMIFFDITPTGRLVNRMSHDVDRMAYPLITQLNSTIASTGWMLAGLIVTCVVAPINLPVLVPALLLSWYYTFKFRSINVHLQRLDATSRSDLQSHVFESITGAVTIRSFRKTDVFLSQCRGFVNLNTRSLYGVAMCQRWVAVRAEMLGVVMCSFVVLLAWILRDSISSGLAGLAIVWGMNMSRSISFTITEGVQGEAKLVSVERIMGFINDLPCEPPRLITTENGVRDSGSSHGQSNENLAGEMSPKTWPASGRIEFRDVGMRYRATLPLVLDGCSMTVEPGQRVGIVGRTGSGKSSLIVALFRLREVEAGQVLIDGVDISTLGLDLLRGGRMCIIPQDPVLFSGTIRTNVDPAGEFSSTDIEKALEAVMLLEYVKHIGGLGAAVEERGKNFSVGQKQLICIARALLRNPRILLMDEATANVDNETDRLIQIAVRSLFKNATVVEVAHRLHTVMDADRVVVMGGGKVLEHGTPAQLLECEDTTFAAMVAATGDETARELRNIALLTQKADKSS